MSNGKATDQAAGSGNLRSWYPATVLVNGRYVEIHRLPDEIVAKFMESCKGRLVPNNRLGYVPFEHSTAFIGVFNSKLLPLVASVTKPDEIEQVAQHILKMVKIHDGVA